MKLRLIAGAVAAAATLAVGTQAAIVEVGPWTSTPLAMSVTLDWNEDTDFYVNGDANWSLILFASTDGATVTYNLAGTHVLAPHPGDGEVPGNATGAIFMTATGSTVGFSASSTHDNGVHPDTWTLDSAPGGTGYIVDVTATHVPEPHHYALFAGLGLVAFGAFRRFRNA